MRLLLFVLSVSYASKTYYYTARPWTPIEELPIGPV